MRKVVSTMFMFLAVLLVWGQTGASFDSDEVKNALSSFQESKSTVIQQAADKNKSEQSESEPKLTHIFDRFQFVVDNYAHFQDNEELRSEAIKITYGFAKEYSNAIVASATDHRISIGSRKFLDVVDNYSPQFDDFYEKAQKYIENHKKETQEVATDVPATNQGNDDLTNSQAETKNTKLPLWYWIIMGVGVIGFVLALFSLLAILRVNTRINHRYDEIKNIEKQVDKIKLQLSEIKPTNFRGTAHVSQGLVNHPTTYQPKQQTRRKEPAIVPQPRYDEPKPQQPIVEQRPTISNLFATIKAGSPLAEFFKVSTENSGDKVFMLILTNPEAEVADFTIVPNMAPDFMKSVIVDRDTYLPAIFCEKSIDSQNPSRIEVLSQGRAKKVDGKWQVQERMSIRLV